jgi:7-keto-8-aminopelargonate synthetase-like enzyme
MPILIGNAETALAFAEHLFVEGVYAPAIRPPTVPDATSRIRVTITSEHNSNHIDHALTAFQRAGRSAGLI